MVSPLVKLVITIFLQIIIYLLDPPNHLIFTLLILQRVPPPEQPQFSHSFNTLERPTTARCIVDSTSYIDLICELGDIVMLNDTKATYCKSIEQCFINLSGKIDRIYTLLSVFLEPLLDCEKIAETSNEDQHPT